MSSITPKLTDFIPVPAEALAMPIEQFGTRLLSYERALEDSGGSGTRNPVVTLRSCKPSVASMSTSTRRSVSESGRSGPSANSSPRRFWRCGKSKYVSAISQGRRRACSRTRAATGRLSTTIRRRLAPIPLS